MIKDIVYKPVSAYNPDYEKIATQMDFTPVVVKDDTNQTSKIRNALIVQDINADPIYINVLKEYSGSVNANILAGANEDISITAIDTGIIQQIEITNLSADANAGNFADIYINGTLAYSSVPMVPSSNTTSVYTWYDFPSVFINKQQNAGDIYTIRITNYTTGAHIFTCYVRIRFAIKLW